VRLSLERPNSLGNTDITVLQTKGTNCLQLNYSVDVRSECYFDGIQLLSGAEAAIMSVLLNSTQSILHDVYNYYLWTLSLAGTVQEQADQAAEVSFHCTKHSYCH
jgi:hypothetical protein